MKVLCVDDSRIMRRMIGDVVTSLGHEMLEAGDGEQALKELDTPLDDLGLILLDWNMPRLTGIELLRSLKSSPRHCHIPVVMVTTEGEDGRRREAMEAGASGYVAKPFTGEELAAIIEDTIATNA